MYMNVGCYVNGKRPASKAALKRALADAPESVEFDQTSAMGPQSDGPITGTSIPAGVKLSVCGPDPYRTRNWFGTVQVAARTGKVTCT